ncbi:hypothetical protein [Halobiforma nitratireducens]|uniref:Uncharacterized protein n=1 Tax=Halobiforma nitratireducens JCM 10879 TaxID=1227454 RepID=M0MHM3_9EURY|nr:hypothetical protein [Halobiforma nitratireducens]EMA45232.1 hypothetical protein C446_02462 [Halobiforma nitratireducens JCM 10879]
MHADLEKLQRDAYNAFRDNSTPPEIRVALDELYREADEHARTVLSDEGFLDFLAAYISREHTKLQAERDGKPEHYPYEETRTRPLCTCSDRYCELKEGRVARQIREADDPLEALRRFDHDHNGEPLVLHDAKEEYARRYGEIEQTYRRIMICGDHDIHPDELDDLEPPIDTEATDADDATAAPADD